MELKLALAEKITRKIWDARNQPPLPMRLSAVSENLPNFARPVLYRLGRSHSSPTRWGIDSAIHDLAVNPGITGGPESLMQERVEQLAFAIADALHEHIHYQQQIQDCIDTLGQNGKRPTHLPTASSCPLAGRWYALTPWNGSSHWPKRSPKRSGLP